MGLWFCRQVAVPSVAVFPMRYGCRIAAALFALFVIGLGGALAWPSAATPSVAGLAAAFYQAGALVFGGGHVVLPLLQQSVVEPGWVSQDAFLAGYGAAQAVPGPMFSLAAFLGAEVPLGLPAALGATIALVAVFLPGFLLLLAVLPAWTRLAQHRWAASAMAGINAAVVGLLGAAFYDPVWTQGIRTATDFAIVAGGFAMLAVARISALWIVLWCVATSIAIHLFG